MNRPSSVFARLCARAAFGLVVLASALAAPLGEAAARSWSTSGSYANIVITDCSNCDEDIGIEIACQGHGQSAQVTVHWAAVEHGREGAILPISFDIDGQHFNFQATTVYFGLTGYTPQFQLYPGHPMLDAMQAGHTARATYAGRTTDISLQGSRFVIDIFKAHCGWQNATVQQPTTPPVVRPTCPAGFVLSGGNCVRAAAPAPAPQQAQFTILHGVDLYGADYSQLPGRVAYQACVSACRRDSRCQAFTYNTNTSSCFLKSWVPNQKPFNAAISGIRR